MAKRLLVLVTFMILLLALAMTTWLPAGTPASDRGANHQDPPTRELLAVAAGEEAFAWDLYGVLRTIPGNLCFSPLSIHAALAMAWSGAAGRTASECATVLHAQGGEAAFLAGETALMARQGSAKNAELTVANRLYGRPGLTFLAPFLDLCSTVYGAPVEQVAFPDPGRARINAWVAESTKGHITDLIPPGAVDADTALVLVNAVYFKAMWAAPFTPGLTAVGPFTTASGTVVNAPFMNRSDDLPVADLDTAWLTELPYAGGDIAMDLIIPKDANGLPATEATLTASALRLAFIGMRPRSVDLALPRFTMRWGTTPLKAALTTLGLTTAFTANADFSRMAQDHVDIADLLHQAFIAVDEQGTVAAAATAVVATLSATAIQPLPLRADHPFLFLIRDVKTEAILFIGRVDDPS